METVSPQLCGHAGCFIAFFSLWNSWIGGPNSPLLLFGSYWLFFLLPLPTQWSKVWFCKEDPAKNLSKHPILEAGALLQYTSYSLVTFSIWLLLQCYVQIIKGTGIWHEGKRVYVGRTMPTDGIYIYRFRVVQGAYECYMLEGFLTTLRFSTWRFSCLCSSYNSLWTVQTPMELSWRELAGTLQQNMLLSTWLMCLSPGIFAPDCIMEFSFLVEGSEIFLSF